MLLLYGITKSAQIFQLLTEQISDAQVQILLAVIASGWCCNEVSVPRGLYMCHNSQICVGEGLPLDDGLYAKIRQVFRVKKLVGRRWGAPNPNYLLVMMSTFVMPFSRDPLSPRMTPGCIMQK